MGILQQGQFFVGDEGADFKTDPAPFFPDGFPRKHGGSKTGVNQAGNLEKSAVSPPEIDREYGSFRQMNHSTHADAPVEDPPSRLRFARKNERLHRPAVPQACLPIFTQRMALRMDAKFWVAAPFLIERINR
jgi:hypothetical protein